jgi:hypothetical protein
MKVRIDDTKRGIQSKEKFPKGVFEYKLSSKGRKEIALLRM